MIILLGYLGQSVQRFERGINGSILYVFYPNFKEISIKNTKREREAMTILLGYLGQSFQSFEWGINGGRGRTKKFSWMG